MSSSESSILWSSLLQLCFVLKLSITALYLCDLLVQVFKSNNLVAQEFHEGKRTLFSQNGYVRFLVGLGV